MKSVSLTDLGELPNSLAQISSGGAEQFLLLQLANLFSHSSSLPLVPPALTDSSQADVPSLQKLYKLLVEQIPAVVFLIYLEGGGVSEAYVSPQIEKSLGFTQEEWLE